MLHVGQQKNDCQKLVFNKCLQTGQKLTQCSNDWVCRQYKQGHTCKLADCTDDFRSNPEDTNIEQSETNDTDSEDNEVP